MFNTALQFEETFDFVSEEFDVSSLGGTIRFRFSRKCEGSMRIPKVEGVQSQIKSARACCHESLWESSCFKAWGSGATSVDRKLWPWCS